MGRNHRYQKTLHEQAYEKLTDMLALGNSKYLDKRTGDSFHKIYSVSTYKTYWTHIKYFLDYVKNKYPNCRKLTRARKYVSEWLQTRVDSGFSAWTIALEASALNKLYQIPLDDPNRFIPPVRLRENIKRSRYPVAMDACFSAENNQILIDFAQATGARRTALANLKGDDLWTFERITKEIAVLKTKHTLSKNQKRRLSAMIEATVFFPDQTYFVYFRRDKGGRDRFAPIIGPNIELVIKKLQSVAPDEHVWDTVHSAADIHSYRAMYAAAIYKLYSRKIEDIPYDKVNKGSGCRYQGDVYVCRGDAHGLKLDKVAMLKCSKALGHNRICVVATNYLWTL